MCFFTKSVTKVTTIVGDKKKIRAKSIFHKFPPCFFFLPGEIDWPLYIKSLSLVKVVGWLSWAGRGSSILFCPNYSIMYHSGIRGCVIYFFEPVEYHICIGDGYMGRSVP